MKELILVLELPPKGTWYDCLHINKVTIINLSTMILNRRYYNAIWTNADTREWRIVGVEESDEDCFRSSKNNVNYIHHIISIQLVHRDIKTTHILIDEKDNAKLIDFKQAIYEPNNMYFRYAVGTKPYKNLFSFKIFLYYEEKK